MNTEKKTGIILDGSKILWHKERLEQWLAGERIAPISIECAITTRCTYKCVYCFCSIQHDDASMNNISLSKDEIFQFLDDAAEIGVKGVNFTGDGENTCNPHLVPAIVRGKANGLDMALATNGYLLKNEDLPVILPLLTYLRFNISSGAPEGYAAIHGVEQKCFYKVAATIKAAVDIKKANNLKTTIGLQMVLMPQYINEVLPLARLGLELGADYLVIKHCSDSQDFKIGVDYEKYKTDVVIDILHQAEAMSTPQYQVSAKWSKILNGTERKYSKCLAAPFLIQFSGSGLVAPCGPFFSERYKKFHIGSLREQSFKEMWDGERYWEVMRALVNPPFNPCTDCTFLCLQHNTNDVLWNITRNPGAGLPAPEGDAPMHVNFV